MKFRLATGMSMLGLMLSCATALGGTLTVFTLPNS